MSQELIIIEEEISPIVASATALKIKSEKDLSISAEMLSQCNAYLDKVTEDKERITKPMNAALKEVRGKYKPVEEILGTAITALRTEQSRYQTEQIKKQREGEAKIAEKVLVGKVSADKGSKQMAKLEVVEKVVTDSGSLNFREDKVLKVFDPSKVPREYLTVDEDRVLEALKAGIAVDGCGLDIVMVPINRR